MSINASLGQKSMRGYLSKFLVIMGGRWWWSDRDTVKLHEAKKWVLPEYSSVRVSSTR